MAKDYGLHKVRYVEMKQELGAKGCNNLGKNCWNCEAVGDFEAQKIDFRGMLRKQTSQVRCKLTIFGTWYNVFRSSRMEMTQGTIEIT